MNETRKTTLNQSQRGFTLTEVLVATAIFTIIFIAALLIWDRSNRVFQQGIEAGDMQQNTRVAFDKLVSDVRMAGFDYDRDGRPFGLLGVQPWKPNTTYVLGNVVQPNPPNGHAYTCIQSGTSNASQPTWPLGSGDVVDESGQTLRWQEKGILQYQQPDEQIEYMGAGAITVRGNLDFELDAANDNGREPGLESEFFPVVTTANDEIVTYALRSADASKNTGKISFYADTAIPRNVHGATGAKEKLVEITGVDLTNANPPYTLYRYTVKDDGTPDAGTALAENLRSLSFRYFRDSSGTDEITPVLGAGQYDASTGTDTVERQARGEIRAIHVNLTGMNPREDAAYTNPTDTVAPNFRQYQLDSMVVPRNLGRRGMKEISVVEPGAPEIQNVCCGSCDVVYVTWKPSLKGDVISYNILYDDDAGGGDYTYLEDAGNNVEGYVQKNIVPNKTWWFKVQAINAYGYAESADFESIMVVNRTTPEAPTGLAASGGADTGFVAEPNQIRLVWPEATTNKDSAKLLTCSDGSTREQKIMPGSERRYYRVYRGKTEDFDPTVAAESTLILDENSTVQPDVNGTNLDFIDTQAANCEPYYYRVQVVDYCARNAAWNSPAQKSVGESDFYPAIGTSAIEGQAQTNVPPAKPIGLTITNTACTGVNCDVTLTWSAVTKEDGNPSGPDIFVEQYDVLIDIQDGSGNWVPQSPQSTANGATTITLSNQKNNEFYRYRVLAKHCVDGPPSEPIYFPCEFSTKIGVSVANFGGDGETAGTPWMVNSPASVGVTTSLPVEKIEMWVEQGGSPLGDIQEAGPGSGATFTLPELIDDEVAVMYVRASDANGCSGLVTRFVMDEGPPPCPATGINLSIGATGTNTITYTVSNSSGQQLTPKRIKIVWDKDKTPSPNANTVIGSVKFNGMNASGVSNTASGSIITGTYLAPAGVPVGGAQTNYPIAIAFSTQANKDLLINPIDSVCMEYQSAQGDLFTCGVVEPGTVSAACSIP